MLEYLIGSGVFLIITSSLADYAIKTRAEELGYISIAKKKEKTPKEHVKSFLCNFIPGVNNLSSLVLFLVTGFVLFAKDKYVAEVFEQVPTLVKASVAKEIYEKRAEENNLSDIEDAMRLDGVDEKTIKKEIKQAKRAAGICDDKTMKKIRAMSDAELWLLEVELNTELTPEEKKSLYADYVKEFSKNKAKPKAIEKTKKMIDKRNR